MPPAPLAGRKHCSRCRRWRIVLDFPPGRKRGDGVPQLSAWCEVCRRRDSRRRGKSARAREGARQRMALRRLRKKRSEEGLRKRAERRVREGEAFWAGPFAGWLERKSEEHGWELLGVWAGTDERNMRRIAGGAQQTVDVGLVDRTLLWEGSTRLEELYPLDPSLF